ncbi:MAG: type II CAAX endopeptidase family protein [Clostridia bacterium]
MEKRKNFRFSNTGNAFLLAFGTYYAVSLIYQSLSTAFFPNLKIGLWLTYLINPCVFVGTMIWYSRKKNVDFVVATRLNGKLNAKQIGIIALLSIFCIMAFLPISNIFLEILHRLGYNFSLSLPDTNENIGMLLLGILFLAVLPAFSEEVLMRGVVLNCAEQKRDYSYAIVLTAAMFSLMHGNAIQTVHQFLLGMVLAYIVIASKSLWAGIILHFLNNFLSIVLDYPVNWFLRLINAQALPDFAVVIIWLISIAVGCTTVVYLLKKFTSVSRDKAQFNDVEIIDVYPEGKGKAVKNEFTQSFIQIIHIFKKGGLKRAFSDINSALGEVAPMPEPDEPTREDLYPSNVKLVFIILSVIWVLTLILGFIQ